MGDTVHVCEGERGGVGGWVILCMCVRGSGE